LLSANLGPNYDFNTRVYVNLNVNGRAWAPDSDPYGSDNVALKSDGYPQAGTTSTRVFISDINDSEADTYLCECVGDMTSGGASISNMGGGTLGARSFSAGRTTWAVTIAGASDEILALKFTSVPSDFGGVKVHPSAYPLDTTKVFRDEALEHFSLFHGLRGMDWLETNGNGSGPNTDTDWATSRAANSDSVVGYPHSVKAVLDLAAEAASKFAWLNVPARATDDFFTGYAAEVQTLRAGSTIVVSEIGNELWNNNLGNSTAYQDIRTAAFALADVRANTDGLQSVDRAAVTRVVTVVLDAPHSKSPGDTIIFSSGYSGGGYQGFDDPGFRTLISGSTGSTLKWTETDGDTSSHSATIEGDNTYVILDPSHTLARTLTSYHVSGVVHPNDVRIRYMFSRAHAQFAEIEALDDTDQHKVVLGTWMDGADIYVGPTMWAAEEYGGLSWLYSLPPSMYVEVTNTGAIASVDDVFDQLDAYVVAIMVKEIKWANFQRTWDLRPMNYESGFHTHVGGSGDPYTTYIIQAHQDDRARQRVKTWWQLLLNRGVRESFFFHAGMAEAPTTGNATWPVTYGFYDEDAGSAKYAAFDELTDETAVAEQEAGVNFGDIQYVDVFPGGFLGQVSTWFVIDPAEAVPDIKIIVAVDVAGDYTLAIDACTDGGGTVAYTASIDGVQVSAGNLPSGSVFDTEPGEAFSTTVTFDDPGEHTLTFHVANASRADWVGLANARLT
jgi:hypothetical protein